MSIYLRYSTLKRFDPTRFWQFCKVGHLTGCDSSKAGCTTRTATLQTCSKWRIPVALVASFMFSRLTNTPTRAPTYYRKKRHASGDLTYSDCIGWILVRSCKSIGRHRETTILEDTCSVPVCTWGKRQRVSMDL